LTELFSFSTLLAEQMTPYGPNIFGAFWIALLGAVTTNSAGWLHLVGRGNVTWALTR
jgi:hypothetical protein